MATLTIKGGGATDTTTNLQVNGLFATGGDASVGADSRTTITISDGAKLSVTDPNNLELSENVRSHTDLTMTGGTIGANGTFLRIGHRGSANVLHTGGSITGNWVHLAGHHVDATASYTLAGLDAVLESHNNLVVGEMGIAHFYHLNGTCKGESFLSIGDSNQLSPRGGRGTYVQTGGTVQTSQLHIAPGWDTTGSYNLYGGELQADWIYVGGGSVGTFHLGGANGVGWIKPKTAGALVTLSVNGPHGVGSAASTFRG